jgi:hypothetical protein
MGKLVSFKRIAVVSIPPKKVVTPVGPVAPVAYQTSENCTPSSDATITPNIGELFVKAVAAMGPITAVEAALMGADEIAAASVHLPLFGGSVLYKESDTGVGFKRWAIWLEHTARWIVWTQWGHESHKQASKKMEFISETRAKMYLRNCLDAKLKKGYRRNK